MQGFKFKIIFQLAIVTFLLGSGIIFHTWEPQVGVYGKEGDAVTNYRIQDFLNHENSIRIGIEIRPGFRIGLDSKHGLGIVFEF